MTDLEVLQDSTKNNRKKLKKQLNSDNITKFTYYHFLIFSNMI